MSKPPSSSETIGQWPGLSTQAPLDPRRVGFDFDGVIADVAEAFLRIACRDYGCCTITIEDITSFELERCLPMEKEVVEAIFSTILHDSVGNDLQPLPGAIETLNHLGERSPITVITARPVLQPVRDWFAAHCPARTARRIELIATGDHDNKESFIRKCGLRHFIDDRASTCRQLAAAGLEPIVYSQPWNSRQHDLPAVVNWQEIAWLFDLPDPL